MLKSASPTIKISTEEYNKLLAIKKLFEGQKEIMKGKAFRAKNIDDLREQLS